MLQSSSGLPIQPDANIMSMLIRAQSFLKHAHHHAAIGNEFDIMISLHNLDNAIEYLLKIIIIHLDLEEKMGKSILENAQLSNLVGDINKYLASINAGGISHVTDLKMIRQLRNLVQHSITFPNVDIQRFMNIGQSFFEKSLQKLFGLSYGDISYSILIDNSVLKQHLIDAEKYLDTSEYLRTIVSSRNAFEYGHLVFEQFRQDRTNLAPALAETKFQGSNLNRYINDLDYKVTIISHGIDCARYLRYRDIVQDIPDEYNSDAVIIMQHKREWTKEDASFCYTFVANTIYDWQLNEPPKNYCPEDFYNVNRQIIMSIAGVDVDGENEYKYLHCGYGYGDYTGELIYAGKETTDNLKRLSSKITSSHGILLTRSVQYPSRRENPYLHEIITELTIDILPVTNSPAVWRIIIWYRAVPFTRDFNSSDISIDDVALEQLQKIITEESKATALYNDILRLRPIDTIPKAIELWDTIKNYEESHCSLHELKNGHSEILFNRCMERSICFV